MTDVLLQVRDRVSGSPSPVMEELSLAEGSYSLATIHRAENTDAAERLKSVLDSLARVDHPVVILAHPRLVAKCVEHGLALESRGSLLIHPPLAYPDLIASALHARGVITDSGGLQKEAFLLRVPCTTVRPQTEWVETVELGWNRLVEPGEALVEAASRPRPAEPREADAHPLRRRSRRRARRPGAYRPPARLTAGADGAQQALSRSALGPGGQA